MKKLYVAFEHGDPLGRRMKFIFLEGISAPKTESEVRAMIRQISTEMQGGPVIPISWNELEA